MKFIRVTREIKYDLNLIRNYSMFRDLKDVNILVNIANRQKPMIKYPSSMCNDFDK